MAKPPTSDTVEAPQDWRKAKLAALYIAHGASMRKSAKSAGIAERTLYTWRNSEWWPQLLEDVAADELADMRYLFRLRVREALNASGDEIDWPTVRWIGERIDPQFAPPVKRAEHSGGIEIVMVDEADAYDVGDD